MSGKTVIFTRIIDLIHNSTFANNNICFFWVSNDPSLNEQSKDKIKLHCETLTNYLTIVDNSNYYQDLVTRSIYFLNYQKLRIAVIWFNKEPIVIINHFGI